MIKAGDKILDKFKGCLIGGAAGDALGGAVEFLSYDTIIKTYGIDGITCYDIGKNNKSGKALITDDTQMTLFTATGLLLWQTRAMTRGIAGNAFNYIHKNYLDWLTTQDDKYIHATGGGDDDRAFSWLVNVPQLNHRRGPGMTCLSALRSGICGTVEKPINISKGCGGVMRVAPVGLFLQRHSHCDRIELDKVAADSAAITHGHELGYIPAACLAHAVSLLVDETKTVSLRDAIIDGIKTMETLYADKKHIKEFVTVMEKAVTLSKFNLPDVEAIGKLGAGWVAEETLAIAVYCALKYQNDFEKTIVAAVNHDGDSDSTGAVCGNILGAYLGLSKIPQKFLDKLELIDVIEEIATDLYNGCPLSEYGKNDDDVWESKYIYMTYPKVCTRRQYELMTERKMYELPEDK